MLCGDSYSVSLGDLERVVLHVAQVAFSTFLYGHWLGEEPEEVLGKDESIHCSQQDPIAVSPGGRWTDGALCEALTTLNHWTGSQGCGSLDLV
jgi:hypothetical protein